MRDAEKVSEVGDEELLEIGDDELDDQDEDSEVTETEHSDVFFLKYVFFLHHYLTVQLGRSLALDHSGRCLSGCPQSFLLAAETNKSDGTATVTSLQQSRGHPPMGAIYFTVKFELLTL